MPFPKTEQELAVAGYEFENTGKCRGCNADIDWFRTPKGKHIPLDVGTLEPHWSNCPKAKEFRR